MKPIKILIVDDNPAIHEAFRKIFAAAKKNNQLEDLNNLLFASSPTTSTDEELTVELFSAYQGNEAILMVEKATHEQAVFQMAFVDIRMPPGMDGIETVKKIWEIDVKLPIVICSAYSDYSLEEIHEQLNFSRNFFIMKKTIRCNGSKTNRICFK